MDPVTLYNRRDGRAVVVRSAVEATNLRSSGYSDTPPAAVTAGDAAEEFDPSQHTIEEVQSFVGEHPDLAEGVLAAERAGKNRAGLVG